MTEVLFTLYMMVGAHLVGFMDAREAWPKGVVSHYATVVFALNAWPLVLGFMIYQNLRSHK